MRDFNKKKEVIDELVYRLESDYQKGVLRQILHDLEHYERITRHEYFYLNDGEAEKANEFYEKYMKGRYFGAIGGGMTYSFMPTGLGSIVHVSTRKDDGERVEEDITDNSNW